MTNPPAQPAPVNVRVAIPKIDDPRPAPESANWFHFSRLDQDFQVLVGYVDIQRVARKVEAVRAGDVDAGKGDGEVVVEITHRFVVPLRGFMHLRREMDQMVARMREQGVPMPESGD